MQSQSWIRPKLRVADNPTRPLGDKQKQKQDLKKQWKKPPAGVPDPNTREGREDMIEKLQLSTGDVEMRARMMKNLITKALQADNRKDFKEQLILMTDQVTQLKMHDVPSVVDAVLNTVKVYEKSQGREFDLNNFRENKDEDEVELGDEDLEEVTGASTKTASVEWVAYVMRG